MFTCNCCGFKTLDEPATGTYEICDLCGWEDDAVQSDNPDYYGGANGTSLREAQYEFLKVVKDIITKDYEKAPDWKILEPPTRVTRLKDSKIDFIATATGRVSRNDA